ncbi:MAG: hypothetical protein ACRCYX_06725 [Dermatophilaceae bacterium]
MARKAIPTGAVLGVPVRPQHRDSARAGPAQIDALQAVEVSQLVQAKGWPSVTVLLDTVPASRMLPADGERLAGLVRVAHQELEARGVDAPEVRRRLTTLAEQARSGPTGRGLALFASTEVARSLRLPVTVEPDVVIEGTFRTREVLQSLHRTPPHLLLVLRATSAQLYRGHADTLVPVGDPAFPVEHSMPVLGALEAGDDRQHEFVRRVDAALATARSRRLAPLIVAGDIEPVRRLLRTSTHLDRLAGVVMGADAESMPALYTAARLSLAEYLRSREEEAIDALDIATAADPAHVYAGIRDCWDAAHAAQPVMLLVEEGHTWPALVDDDGIRRLPADSEPGTGSRRSDLVDDLVETVIDRGGWVAFARNGRLADHDRVALVTAPDR